VEEQRKWHCTCPEGEGYISINGTCVQIDPCNEEHRKAKGLSATVCLSKNAACRRKSVDSNNDFFAYSCVCNEGFVNQGGRTDPSIVKCLHEKCEVELATCDQICIPNGKEYECQCVANYSRDKYYIKCKADDQSLEQDCQSNATPAPFVKKGKCQCADGLMWNQTQCILDGRSNMLPRISFLHPLQKHTIAQNSAVLKA